MTLGVGNFIAMHPSLIHEVAGHALAHTLHSYIRHSGRRRGVSRRKSRKLSNSKRRWFVDNIIMHHKRLHERNRAILITNARSRALARRKEQQEKSLALNASLRKNQDQSTKWRDKFSIKERGIELRQRTQAKRSRAMSRWRAIADSTNGNNPAFSDEA
jgi:hypothetical protein